MVHCISYITAAGRSLLNKYERKAGHNHVFYYDTDSLLVDDIGLKNL